MSKKCPACKGEGVIKDPLWHPKESNLGYQGYQPCKICGGRGKITIKEDKPKNGIHNCS